MISPELSKRLVELFKGDCYAPYPQEGAFQGYESILVKIGFNNEFEALTSETTIAEFDDIYAAWLSLQDIDHDA